VQPAVITAADIARQPSESFPDTSVGVLHWKTLVSNGSTTSNELTAGIATCPAGDGHLKLHRHTQDEIYYIVSGRGIMTIDGTKHHVGQGAVVFIPGDAEHGIRKSSGDEDLVWLYGFAADSFGEIHYRFSGGDEQL